MYQLPLPKTEPCTICEGLDSVFPMKVPGTIFVWPLIANEFSNLLLSATPAVHLDTDKLKRFKKLSEDWVLPISMLPLVPGFARVLKLLRLISELSVVTV